MGQPSRPNSARLRLRFALAGLALAVLLPFLWWFFRAPLAQSAPERPASQLRKSTQTPESGPPATDDSAAKKPNAITPSADLQEVARLRLLLADLVSRWESFPDSPALLAETAALHQQLLEADPVSGAAAIIAELRSGVNRETGLPFLVGPEGVLDAAPTWRTTLLDWLGQMDPRQAAAYSREILQTTNSADEYALALRNLVWAMPPPLATAEIAGYLQNLLDRSDWRANPSAGYLEAFDIALELGETGLQQMLGALRSAAPGESVADRAVEHAAFVALDRLLLRDPALFVRTMEKSPELLRDLPDHRASLYSRLDVRQPQQARFLESYLRQTPPDSPEMLYFFSIFPNPNRFVNHRLVSQSSAERPTEPMVEVDRAVIERAKQWLGNPELAPQHENLRFLILRLQEFL